VLALVPADPLPPPAAGAVSCVAAAGDAVAYLRETGHASDPDAARKVPQLDAAGQRLTLAPASSDQDCPTIAVAADGTAVAGFIAVPGDILSSSPRIVVRRPGATFGPARGVGAPRNPALLAAPAVAAAPGGWVAAAWVQEADSSELAVAVVAPDGTMHTTVLDSGPLFDTGYSWPQVGIDASGAATVAWTRWDMGKARPALEHARLARSASGGATWEPVRDLGTGERGSSDSQGPARVGLSVTPGGGMLAAWTNGLAVQAVEDDGAPVTVASLAGAGVPVVTRTDAGAALVAFPQLNPSDDRDIGVYAVDRAAGGPWSAPRRIAAPARLHADTGAEVDDLPLATALAPDGRALIAWPVLDFPASLDRMLVATGTIGSGYGPARVLSIPTRERVGAPAAWVDASGDPRVAWIEGSTSGRARLRADRLAANPPALDTTAPRLTATLPRTVRVDHRGIRPVHITVRCSEACDVRALVQLPGLEAPEADAVRTAPAGRTARVTVREQGGSFLLTPRPRHLRLRVIAADRAGNVSERSRLAVVKKA
jgi:hypothetical protein